MLGVEADAVLNEADRDDLPRLASHAELIIRKVAFSGASGETLCGDDAHLLHAVALAYGQEAGLLADPAGGLGGVGVC